MSSDASKSPLPDASTTPISPIQVGDDKKDSNIKPTPRLTWTNETENLLQGWADIASCFNWMHTSSFRKYSKVNNYFAIPIIILSTVGGTLNVSLQGYVPSNYLNYAQAAIGGLGIFTGILTTLQNLFKYAQLSEAHNNVSIGWSKLNRNIQIELSVARESRKDADSFIKICRSEYDRLIEQSPTIPVDIIELFKNTFREQNRRKKEEKLNKLKERENVRKQVSKGKTSQYMMNVLDEIDEDELVLPDICDSINHTKVYKSVLIDKPIIDNQIDLTTKSNDTEYEVKSTILDKINELDAKTSGIHQYKIAMIGERLAPLHHENYLYSNNSDDEGIYDKANQYKQRLRAQTNHDSERRSSKSFSGSRNLNKINNIESGNNYGTRTNEISKFSKIVGSLQTKTPIGFQNSEDYKYPNNQIGNPGSSLRSDERSSLGPGNQLSIKNVKDEINELSNKGLVKNMKNLFGSVTKKFTRASNPESSLSQEDRNNSGSILSDEKSFSDNAIKVHVPVETELKEIIINNKNFNDNKQKSVSLNDSKENELNSVESRVPFQNQIQILSNTEHNLVDKNDSFKIDQYTPTMGSLLSSLPEPTNLTVETSIIQNQDSSDSRQEIVTEQEISSLTNELSLSNISTFSRLNDGSTPLATPRDENDKEHKY